ncbi:MAG: four helix bundle protein [Terracidiphilus sp.]|nr:four helix bundle protein [Terracidiphilus sp.]
MAGSFQELVVWKKSIELALSVYRLTAQFPDVERFGLTNQMRRAAVSISSNIAEGAGRATKGEFIQFLGIARGSNFELESQCVIARGLGFGKQQDQQEAEKLSNDVGRLLSLLIKSLHVKKEEH